MKPKNEAPITDGFEASTGGNTAPLKAQIEEFVSTFKKSEIVEGNVFDIIYVPGKGVESYKNGKLQGTIRRNGFQESIVWNLAGV